MKLKYNAFFSEIKKKTIIINFKLILNYMNNNDKRFYYVLIQERYQNYILNGTMPKKIFVYTY